MKMRYGIFDVDGTLFDSMSQYLEIFARCLYPLGISTDESKNFFRQTAGMPLSEQFYSILFQTTQFKISPTSTIVQELVKKFFKISDQESPMLFPTVRKVLRKLRKEGFQLFATSGYRDEVLHQRFQGAKIDSLFQCILGSSRIRKGPRHIEFFANNCGVSFKEFCSKAFYVGDGPGDMIIAAKCGIFGIGITTTVPKEKLKQKGAKKIIRSLDELLNFLF